MHRCLIPGDLTFIGLVGVGDEPGFAVRHTFWRDRKRIRSVARRIATNRSERRRSAVNGWHFIRHQLTDHTIKSKEKWRTQHKTSGDIFAVDGKQL